MTDFVCTWLDNDDESHVLHHLHRIEKLMTEANAQQAQEDTDVQNIGAALEADRAELKAEIDALKAQIAAGVPAPSLDLTGLDKLATQATADQAADAPAAVAAPVVDPTAAAPAPTPVVATSDPTAPAAAPTDNTPAPTV